MILDNEIKLDFSDVLIRPKRSTLESRSQVKLEREFKTSHGTEFSGIPIIAANMATGTFEMLQTFAKNKMFVAIAKHNNKKWYDIFSKQGLYPLNDMINYGFYTIGMSEQELKELQNFEKHLIQLGHRHDIKICIDIANGYTQRFASFVSQVRKEFPENIIIAGNVATPEMVQELVIAGADYVKIGLGPGAMCSTRLKTGVGYPQISAAIECFEPNTLIVCKDKYKKICDIKLNDLVLTHKNRYMKIKRIIKKIEEKTLYNINENKSTKNHEYYVLNKKYKNIVTDDNIHEYAEWISAENLTPQYFLIESTSENNRTS